MYLSIKKTWTTHSPCQSTKDVLDVGVVSSRLGDGDAQLGVAQRPDGGDYAGDDPDNQSHAHWAGILHHALWTDEDTWANNITWWRAEGERERFHVSVMSLKHSHTF